MADDHRIRDTAALEACIGTSSAAVAQKTIDHLDAGARRWLAASPLVFAGFGGADGPAITLGGGVAGFTQVVDESRLRIRRALLDHADLPREGFGVGLLFLVPTIGETLRVNGRVAAIDRDHVEIAVDECYIHCAKAIIRSSFWQPLTTESATGADTDHLAASRFIALATVDAEGRCDVSPKGDPDGSSIRVENDVAWFADRPGNRRADSFRNILSQPRVALAAVCPGSTRVALLNGTARLTTDDRARAAFAVQDKAPKLAIAIEQPALTHYDSASLSRARLWPAMPPSEPIDGAALLIAHIRLNATRGLKARFVRTAVAVPGLVQRELDHDYKTNLY
ncbi:MAG: pyridoxamine 5'-phosphate oxidase family protein [Acidobacteria bacterium]|nr:pyridoxamine 5'-phosphate oxidase family protein [Acidobacteriota bacterium]